MLLGTHSAYGPLHSVSDHLVSIEPVDISCSFVVYTRPEIHIEFEANVITGFAVLHTTAFKTIKSGVQADCLPAVLL